MEEHKGTPGWIWVAVGCGGLALLAACVVPAAAFVLFVERYRVEDPERPIVDVDPQPLPDPGPAPTPGPGAQPPPSGGAVPPGGGAPGLPPPPAFDPPEPRTIVASVTEVDGLPQVAPGARCEFPVTVTARPGGTFWCNAQIRCGGELLYGGQNAGFFDCTLYEGDEPHVVGEDDRTTGDDGDSAMRIDSLNGVISVRDDANGRLGAFTLSARIESVR
ncbi:MAG: hypothetical protein ACFCGT_21195 [Sandaracinaceae bacterium]